MVNKYVIVVVNYLQRSSVSHMHATTHICSQFLASCRK